MKLWKFNLYLASVKIEKGKNNEPFYSNTSYVNL